MSVYNIIPVLYISNIYIYTHICFCPSPIVLSLTYARKKKNTHQNVLYDPRWSKWYRNGALALTNRGVILLKPQPNRSKLHGLKVWWSKLPTCENKGLDTARLKNLFFHLTNRYIWMHVVLRVSCSPEKTFVNLQHGFFGRNPGRTFIEFQS